MGEKYVRDWKTYMWTNDRSIQNIIWYIKISNYIFVRKLLPWCSAPSSNCSNCSESPRSPYGPMSTAQVNSRVEYGGSPTQQSSAKQRAKSLGGASAKERASPPKSRRSGLSIFNVFWWRKDAGFGRSIATQCVASQSCRRGGSRTNISSFLTGNKPWIFLHTIFSFRRGNLIVCSVHILMPLHSDSFLRGIF